MRVLLINSRVDSETRPGGDTIQFHKTKSALQNLGVRVEVRSPRQLEEIPPCDIAHVFNIQMPESAENVCRTLEERHIPIALSPIYWDVLPLWFELAAKERPRWKYLVRLFGKGATGRLYAKWQKIKSPASAAWQIQRRLLKRAHGILPNSESEADILQTSFRLGADFRKRIHIIPNGIDADLYRSIPKASDAFLMKHGVRDFVLEIGMIYPTKNQLGLIEALYDLPVPLVFIGSFRADMQDYANACRIRGSQRGGVTFVAHMPHEELPGIYSLAAVHALPSWRETPGLVSLEAAAAGCRIVSTCIGSARDYLGDLAWYCHPGDPKSIRKAVEDALNSDPPAGLRQHVLDKYTWCHAGEATLHSYEKILRNGS